MSEEQKVQREQQMAVLTKIGRGEDFHTEMFGENVYVFSPVDDAAQVQGILDRLWSAQEKNQFGWERYCVYFLPGEYDKDISVKVGYYMQVSGLGYLPDDTQIKTLNCDARWLGGNDNHNATCNFWRGVENLRVNSTVMWAVSQATFMRRMHITGLLYLHDNNGWASGGFLSDSLIGGMVDSGSQQQWLSRNCNWNGWRGSNWNIVFAGIPKGKTPTATWPNKQYTNVETVEEMQEKPFLVYDGEKGVSPGSSNRCGRDFLAGGGGGQRHKTAGRGIYPAFRILCGAGRPRQCADIKCSLAGRKTFVFYSGDL